MSKQDEAEDPIGFIGFGAMGCPIAENLLREGGFKLRAYNRTTDTLLTFTESLPSTISNNVSVVRTPRDCAKHKNSIVVSIVSNDSALRSIVTDPGGVLEGLGEGGIHLCLSTVSPTITEEMETLHLAHGVSYISCPVFGRPPVAKAKRLIVVASGPQPALDRVNGILQAISQKVVYGGESPRNSNVLKLCGNFMILSIIQAQAECFAMAESAGVSRETAFDLISGPDGVFSKLPLLETYGKMIATRNYPVGFSAENGLKDATLALNLGEAGGVDMPLGKIVKERLEKVVSEPGGKDKDWATFAELV